MSKVASVWNARGVWLALIAALALDVSCGGTADDDGEDTPGDRCTANGVTYDEGESIPARDSCNTCTCLDGQVACTARGCAEPQCTYDGRMYDVGDTFMSTDGCNTCSCAGTNLVACTERACNVEPLSCDSAGTTLASGQSIYDGCNTCTCFDGSMQCTLIDCAVPCASAAECADDAYCALAEGSCVAGSGFEASGTNPAPGQAPRPRPVEGTCQSRPQGCTRESNPVCGCDGVTYGNPCTAAAAGINVAYAGVCG
jgi:hypothetical protein